MFFFQKNNLHFFVAYLNDKMQTVEKRPREMMLRREFASAVGYLNQVLPVDNHLRFIHWDFHKFAKR